MRNLDIGPQTKEYIAGIACLALLRLGYSRELASNKRLVNVAAADGTPFVVSGVNPSRDMLTAGLGVTLRAQANIFVYANYDALVSIGNTSGHIVSAGLRVRF